MAAPRITLGTVVRVVLVCFLVGLVLKLSGVDPRNLFHDLFALAEWLVEWSVDFFGWAITYIWMGAAVVLPVWAVILLFRFLRGRP